MSDTLNQIADHIRHECEVGLMHAKRQLTEADIAKALDGMISKDLDSAIEIALMQRVSAHLDHWCLGFQRRRSA